MLLGSGETHLEFGEVRKLTFDEGLELMPAISPDGQEIAYISAASTSDTARVSVVGVDGGRPSRVSDEARIGERTHVGLGMALRPPS